MSLPAGHAVVGWAAAEAMPGAHRWDWWRMLLFAAVVANLPDLDFLPGVLIGDPDRWHHGPSHSFFAAVVAGAAGGLVCRSLQGRGLAPALLTGSVYLSHVLLDLITPQRATDGAGVALLWPLTPDRFALSLPYPAWLHRALTLDRGSGTEGFLSSLVSLEMLKAMATETLLFLPLLALILIRRRTRRSSLASRSNEPEQERPKPHSI